MKNNSDPLASGLCPPPSGVNQHPWQMSVGAGLLLLTTPLVAHSETRSLLPAQRKPNIILIVADDLGYGDLGAYGQRKIQTPHLDRLAARGTRLTSFYAGSSVCAPSRCVLLTGRHNGQGRIRDNLPHGVHLLADDVTVAELLRADGYRTGAFGKWSLGDHWEAGAPWRKGFDEFFGYPNQDHAHFYYPHFLWDHDRVLLLPDNRPSSGRRGYVPDLLLERAVQFIARSAQDSRPFFLYFPTILPHWSEYPKDGADSHPVPSDAPYSHQAWPQVEKNYAAMITLLDKHVGQLVAQVEAMGLTDETLIFFTSDNGPSAETVHDPDFFRSSGPFRGVKRQLYEGSLRVPFLACWPGVIPPGTVSDAVCGAWDIFPTLADLTGRPVPFGSDGVSLRPVLTGAGPLAGREFLYWDYGHVRPVFMQAVRAGDWKLIRQNGAGAPPVIELFDLSQDSGEEHNLAAAYPEVVARLEGLLERAYSASEAYPRYSSKP